jgi:death-on-curing protein
MENSFDIVASQEEKYEMTVIAGKGEIGFDEIKQWLTKRIKDNN